MTEDTIEEDEDQALTMVDEALVAGNIANTNGLLVILARLVAKGVTVASVKLSGTLSSVRVSFVTLWGNSLPSRVSETSSSSSPSSTNGADDLPFLFTESVALTRASSARMSTSRATRPMRNGGGV